MGEGKSLRAAASELRVSVANLSRWVLQGVGKIDHLDKILRSKKKAALPGPVSQLQAIEGALLRYIFEYREQGLSVNTFNLAMRASFLSPEFREKSFTARCSAVKRFMIAHLFSYRMETHTSQCPPAKTESEAFNFMRFMRRIVSGGNRDLRFTINMDQTPVYFLMNAKRTFEVVGKKTIHIHTSTNDTKRVTVAVTITADGTLLPLMLIFKGKPNGRIVRMEFPRGDYPTTHFYKYQDNAWMDEEVMIPWVNKVLAPYVATAPDHAVPILILDMYQCHMMASVVQMIQELGVEVQHIPGRCTSLCQPMDVGFNKPFKDRMRQQWFNWMIAEGIVHGTTSPPTRLDVGKWVDVTMLEMKGEGQIICNAWKRHRYEWFVNNTPVEQDVVNRNF